MSTATNVALGGLGLALLGGLGFVGYYVMRQAKAASQPPPPVVTVPPPAGPDRTGQYIQAGTSLISGILAALADDELPTDNERVDHVLFNDSTPLCGSRCACGGACSRRLG